MRIGTPLAALLVVGVSERLGGRKGDDDVVPGMVEASGSEISFRFTDPTPEGQIARGMPLRLLQWGKGRKEKKLWKSLAMLAQGDTQLREPLTAKDFEEVAREFHSTALVAMGDWDEAKTKEAGSMWAY
eukprot:Polyplicarium_translucidae@DN246_c0_g1_i1.p2